MGQTRIFKRSGFTAIDGSNGITRAVLTIDEKILRTNLQSIGLSERAAAAPLTFGRACAILPGFMQSALPAKTDQRRQNDFELVASKFDLCSENDFCPSLLFVSSCCTAHWSLCHKRRAAGSGGSGQEGADHRRWKSHGIAHVLESPTKNSS